MKIKLLVCVFTFFGMQVTACPTCVGKIRPESPLFFSDEFYKPAQSSGILRDNKEEVGRNELKKILEKRQNKK